MWCLGWAFFWGGGGAGWLVLGGWCSMLGAWCLPPCVPGSFGVRYGDHRPTS